jgi:hypothetical protein
MAAETHRTGAKRTDGRNGGDDLAELELVQYGGLTSCVETDHEDTHLPLGEELLEQLGEGEPHGGSTPRGRRRDREAEPERKRARRESAAAAPSESREAESQREWGAGALPVYKLPTLERVSFVAQNGVPGIGEAG